MVYGPTGNRVAWLPLYNLNCKARNTPVDKTGVNFSCCSQGVLRTVDAPSLLFRLNRALELIRCCEKELCEIQTCLRGSSRFDCCRCRSSLFHVLSVAADEPSVFTVVFQDLPQGVRAADLEARAVEEVFHSTGGFVHQESTLPKQYNPTGRSHWPVPTWLTHLECHPEQFTDPNILTTGLVKKRPF